MTLVVVLTYVTLLRVIRLEKNLKHRRYSNFELVLPSGLVIVLDNCYYAPTTSRNGVSVLRLKVNGHVNRFMVYQISVSKNNVCILMLFLVMTFLKLIYMIPLSNNKFYII